MKNVRVNLTISEPVAAVVGEVAELTGQSMSGAIAAFLAWKLPELREWVAGYWIAADRKASFLPGSGSGAGSAGPGYGVVGGTATVGRRQASGAAARETVSRAERRQREREEKRLERQLRAGG